MTERIQPDFAAAAKRLFGRRVEELGAIERDVLTMPRTASRLAATRIKRSKAS